MSFTSQNIAPYLGGGESQTRYRFLVPPAHVVEHGVHSLHVPQPPRSESMHKKQVQSKYKFIQMHHHDDASYVKPFSVTSNQSKI